MTHSEFDSVFGNHKKNANSTKANSNSFEDEECCGLNGRGGFDEFLREDNPFGEFR